MINKSNTACYFPVAGMVGSVSSAAASSCRAAMPIFRGRSGSSLSSRTCSSTCPRPRCCSPDAGASKPRRCLPGSDVRTPRQSTGAPERKPDKTGRFPSRREPPSAAGTGSLPLRECAKARSGCGSPETKGISPLNRKKSGCHPGGTGAEIGLAERTPVYPLFSKAEKPPLTHVRGGRTSTVPP